MRRRDLVRAAAVLAVSWRVGARAASTNAHIGFIVTGEAFPRHYFDEAMRRLGYVEGSNLTVDRRITGEDLERRKRAAAELVAARPDVIVAAGVFDARPVFAESRTIPIVVITGAEACLVSCAGGCRDVRLGCDEVVQRGGLCGRFLSDTPPTHPPQLSLQDARAG